MQHKSLLCSLLPQACRSCSPLHAHSLRTWMRRTALATQQPSLVRAGICTNARWSAAIVFHARSRCHALPPFSQASCIHACTAPPGSFPCAAPHMHAYALELLLPQLRPGGKVLDVGSGTGWALGRGGWSEG